MSTALLRGRNETSASSTVLGFDILEHNVLNEESKPPLIKKGVMFGMHI